MGQQFMNSSEVKPPKEIEQRVLSAIQGALQEEKQPRYRRFVKVGVATAISTAILAVPIALVFREQLDWVWKVAALVWASCFCVGFSLYFYPQPRLTVSGYWAPSIFAKILIGMTLLTGVQILLCPSFVFLDSPTGWAPFAPITEAFMSWGGMKACMFSCGLLFSSLGALATFLMIRKVLSRSSAAHLVRAAGLAYLTQLPVIGVQVVDEGLRPFALYWGVGSAAGLVGAVFLVGLASRLARKN